MELKEVDDYYTMSVHKIESDLIIYNLDNVVLIRSLVSKID